MSRVSFAQPSKMNGWSRALCTNSTLIGIGQMSEEDIKVPSLVPKLEE